MWDWSRAIVEPLVLEGFVKSMREQRARYEQHRPLTAEQDQDWAETVRLGDGLLRGYFEWAATMDRFDSILVESDLDLTIPDPDSPAEGLTTPAGDTIYYRERMELLVADENDMFWVVTHRLADPDWATEDQLVLDEEALAQCWACDEYYMKVTVAGTIYNEMRISSHPSVAAAPDGGPELGGAQAWPERKARRWSEFGPAAPPRPATQIVGQETSEHFRRTKLARSKAELEGFGRHLAQLARSITDPNVGVYSTPSWAHCATCRYRGPCIAMTQGRDVAPVLAASYRDRGPEQIERGRIGPSAGTWFAR
jgi:hypothetical protein